MSHAPAALDDYRWLVSSEAERWLSEMAASSETLVRKISLLRKVLPAPRAHLVLEQIELRRRAHVKFSHAERMFFTARGLEQATDEVIAEYKAHRFGQVGVHDLCCGIGGDLMALGRRGVVVGVDQDPVSALLAAANCRATSSPATGAAETEVLCADVADVLPEPAGAWHIDPDRRPEGKRTTRVELHSPGPEVLEKLLATCGNAAIKLAPAAVLPDGWSEDAELEWIGHGRECKQLAVWFGNLTRQPGQRAASLVGGQQCDAHTFVGRAHVELPVADRIGRYVYEPHAAVLAAELTGAKAAAHGLAAITPSVAYLTGDVLIEDPLLAGFEVLEMLPFDKRKLKRLFAERRIGRLEVKKRGVDLDPAKLQRELRSTGGDEQATLIVTRAKESVVGIVALRV